MKKYQIKGTCIIDGYLHLMDETVYGVIETKVKDRVPYDVLFIYSTQTRQISGKILAEEISKFLKEI